MEFSIENHLRHHSAIQLSDNGIWRTKNDAAVSYPSESYNLVYSIEDTSLWYQYRNEVILDFLNSAAKPGLFLDVGGGSGYVSQFLQKNGWQPVLIEPGAGGAQNGKHRQLNVVVQASLHDLQLPKDSIPAVGLFDVLEHIQDDLSELREIHNILSPNGILALAVPAFSCLWSHDDIYAGHFRRYNAQTLAAVLEKAGFVIHRKSYFFSFLWLPSLLIRSLPYGLGLKATSKQQETEHYQTACMAKDNFLRSVLKKIFSLEGFFIRNGFSIPFGTSLIVIAKKAK